mmetsp:Transcript_34643/g.106075  ORF Transcript_34643/g.106075 Transcript_34643/m.106075 type:complete len:266 (-) Transcript_34643:343-1140(-)
MRSSSGPRRWWPRPSCACSSLPPTCSAGRAASRARRCLCSACCCSCSRARRPRSRPTPSSSRAASRTCSWAQSSETRTASSASRSESSPRQSWRTAPAPPPCCTVAASTSTSCSPACRTGGARPRGGASRCRCASCSPPSRRATRSSPPESAAPVRSTRSRRRSSLVTRCCSSLRSTCWRCCTARGARAPSALRTPSPSCSRRAGPLGRARTRRSTQPVSRRPPRWISWSTCGSSAWRCSASSCTHRTLAATRSSPGCSRRSTRR